MNKKILFSSISVLSMVGLLAGVAFANFTGSATNANNAFASGSLILTVNADGKIVGTPTFTVTNVAPGDAKYQLIHMNNTGTIASTATFLTSIGHSTTSTPDLGDKLLLSVYNDPAGDDTFNGTIVTDPGANDVLVGGPTAINSGSWSNIPLGFGIPALGTHQIVAKVQFDPTADSTYQLTNSTFDLNFQTNQ